ncbi:MAG: hypothetical protein QM601_05815 [Pseudoxanthomonas sp.]
MEIALNFLWGCLILKPHMTQAHILLSIGSKGAMRVNRIFLAFGLVASTGLPGRAYTASSGAPETLKFEKNEFKAEFSSTTSAGIRIIRLEPVGAWGFKVGDTLTKINDAPVEKANQLFDFCVSADADPVVEIIRDGKLVSFVLKYPGCKAFKPPKGN